MYYLGIDLGGTNIATAVVNEQYEILGRGKLKTRCPRPAAEIADDIAAACKMALEEAGLTMADIEGVGAGIPGTVNKASGIIEYSNNLGFDQVPMQQMLRERLGCDVYLENDANAAAYGELLAGAGKGCDNFVAITLGTGVGSGIIVDGKIVSGMNFAGGELGHTVIVKDGAMCTCGRPGCWESYASATGLIRLTREAMEKNPDSKMWELAGSLEQVNGRTAFDAMRAGDEAGSKVAHDYMDYVACGLVNVINIFQPTVVCIGGGISKEGETLLAPIRAYVERERYSKHSAKQTELKTAQLGNDAGIIGAAFLKKLYA